MTESKGTCCGKCGHVHVKGTSCPKPFLTGKHHCSRKTNEMHTIDDDGPTEFQQVRADHEEGLKNTKDNPCWRGYHPVGTKIKNGQEVPNCVPVNENKDQTIECEKCGWRWKLSDSGKDTYVCHECGFDSTDKYDIKSKGLETEDYCPHCLAEYIVENLNRVEEAEYHGRKVNLGKPFLTPGGPKKRSVYVKNAKGNVIKVNFGDPNMRIKKSIPARRRSYRARHHCENPGPRTKANYWSCRAW
jgi:predicted RNA-binding Zn-ribbon protein involved in translation (DUF1610 family)